MGANLPNPNLMKCPGHSQGKGGNRCFEGRAILGDQLITAFHAADRSFQHAETVIPVFAAGRNYGLFADHAFALHLLHLTVGIGNEPVSTDELGRNCAIVTDADVINEHILTLFRVGMFFGIVRLNRYRNRIAFIVITNDRRRILPSRTG